MKTVAAGLGKRISVPLPASRSMGRPFAGIRSTVDASLAVSVLREGMLMVGGAVVRVPGVAPGTVRSSCAKAVPIKRTLETSGNNTENRGIEDLTFVSPVMHELFIEEQRIGRSTNAAYDSAEERSAR